MYSDRRVNIRDEFLEGRTRAVAVALSMSHLRNAPAALRSRLFLRYWTLKEALLKAAALGFTVPPNTVIIDAGPSPAVLSVPDALGSAAQWRLIAPPPSGSYAISSRREIVESSDSAISCERMARTESNVSLSP